MADLAQLERALINADKAGDAQGATVLAGEIRRMRSVPKAPIPTPDFEQEAARLQSTTGPELILGSAPGRFALGAASPFIGAAQLAANAVGAGKPVNEWVQRLEQMKKRGMEALPNEGVQQTLRPELRDMDIAGGVGTILSPAALGAMKLAPAASFGGKVAQGAAIGAGFGGTSPVVNGGDNFLEEKLAQTGIGAGIGAAIPAGIGAAGAAYGVGRNVIQPWLGQKGIDRAAGRTLNKAAGPDRDAIIAAMRQPNEIVPGSMPTAGEAAARVGRAEFSALQEVIKHRDPTPYDRIGISQQAARNAQIGTFAGDRAKLADALKARDTAADDAYGAVRGDRINLKSDAAIMDEAIASRDAARVAALQDAGRFQTAAAQQENLAHGGTVNLRGSGQTPNTPEFQVGVGGGQARSPSAYPVEGYPRIPGRYTSNIDRVSEALSGADDAAGVAALRGRERDFLTTQADMMRQTTGLADDSIASLLSTPSMKSALKDARLSAAEQRQLFSPRPNEELPVGALQRIKMSLDAGIKAAEATTAAGRRPQLLPGELLETRNTLVKLLSDKSPGWRDARQQYHLASRGTNQMEIGQELQARLADASGKPTPGRFLSAVDERTDDAVTKLVRHSVTGKPRYTELAQALEPQNVAATRSVADDIRRSGEHQRLADVGDVRARQILNQIVPKIPPSGMFAPLYSVTRATMNRISGVAEGKSLARLNEVMRDPRLTAQLMEAATPSERAVLAEFLLAQKGGRFATIAAALGSAQGQ